MGASAEAIHAGIVAAGIEFCIYLPDSGTGALTALLEAEERMTTIVCAREDEGSAFSPGVNSRERRFACKQGPAARAARRLTPTSLTLPPRAPSSTVFASLTSSY